MITNGVRKACELDLVGAKSLEFIVTNGGDNHHQDHDFWITPLLKR